MHPFPPVDRLNFLEGRELSGICIYPFSVHLAFDPGGISLEHFIEFVSPNGNVSRHDIGMKSIPDPITFHQLVGQKVMHISATETRLSLTFEEGGVLHIETELGPYECGQIWAGPYKDPSGDLIVF